LFSANFTRAAQKTVLSLIALPTDDLLPRQHLRAVSNEYGNSVDHGIGAAASEAKQMSSLKPQITRASRAGKLAYSGIIKWYCLSYIHQSPPLTTVH
jgi:hypothetical protein